MRRSGRGNGDSMNPSARQRRYHDRWVHYTIIAGALRRSGRASGWPYFFRNTAGRGGACCGEKQRMLYSAEKSTNSTTEFVKMVVESR